MHLFRSIRNKLEIWNNKNFNVLKRANKIKRSNPHHDHVPSDEMDLLIETINKMDLGWKADTCKLQKHHPMYDQ